MSENVYVALVFAWMVLLLVANGLYFTWLRFRIRTKGYRSPLVAVAVGIPPFTAFFGGLIFFITSDPLAKTNALTYDPGLVGGSLAAFAIYVGGPSLAVALAGGLVAMSLPARHVRSFGAREVVFPWRRAGQLLIGVAALLLCLEWMFGVKRIPSTRIAAQLLLPAILYCFYMAHRASAPDLNAAIATDLRAPVLYLRAFNRETDVFADVGLAEIQNYTSDILNNSAVTFEQYFARTINTTIGPFVALGSPEDYLPPEGAARTYAADSDWMGRFTALSDRAACLLMEVDDSKHLHWELESLRRTGLQTKLYVLTRPRAMRGWRNARIVLGRQAYRLLARLKGLRPVAWRDFVAATRRLGYSFPPEDPGPGAVISVDTSGTGMVIAQNAMSPEDYLAPIAAQRVRVALAATPATPRLATAKSRSRRSTAS